MFVLKLNFNMSAWVWRKLFLIGNLETNVMNVLASDGRQFLLGDNKTRLPRSEFPRGPGKLGCDTSCLLGFICRCEVLSGSITLLAGPFVHIL